MTIKDKFYKYFMSDKFKEVRLSKAASDLANIAIEDLREALIDTVTTANIKITKLETDLNEANEKLANIKYLNKDNLIKVVIQHLDKVHYKNGSDAFFTALLTLAIPNVDRDKIVEVLNTYKQYYTETDMDGKRIGSGYYRIQDIISREALANEIIKSIGGK